MKQKQVAMTFTKQIRWLFEHKIIETKLIKTKFLFFIFSDLFVKTNMNKNDIKAK